MLKYGGETVKGWISLISKQSWKQREVTEEWKKAVIIPLIKGKESKNYCNNYVS